MAKCSYCQEDELLPFTCRYCSDRFCRLHHLPERHECKGLAQEKLLKRRQIRPLSRSQAASPPTIYKRAYEIPGVMEVPKKRMTPERAREQEKSKTIEVNERLVAAAILALILVLGAMSRFL